MPPREVEGSLKMHPYAAKLLVGRLQNTDLTNLRLATEALAQLERWCRGDADYGDELALTLALRTMTGRLRRRRSDTPAGNRRELAQGLAY